MSRSSNGFFRDQTDLALTTAFQVVDFGFTSIRIFIASDSATIEYSLNGTDVHGRLTNGQYRDMEDRVLSRLFIRGTAGGEAYRLDVY